MPLLHRIARRLSSPLLAPLTDQRPAARLIRHSAKTYWKPQAINFSTSLAASLSEGATLGIIFQSVSLISAPETSDWSQISVLGPLHTRIGEPGYRLSGGQRRRISLARAILRRPERLILNEATGALDSQSEPLVQQTLADRLRTFVNADMIRLLFGGRIVERGRHHVLLSQGGFYAKLWSDQSKHPLEKPMTIAMA